MEKNSILEIIRPQQWYKNLLIFLPLIFSLQLFDLNMLFRSILGFIVLCIAFGGMYIINDVIDSKKDKIHPKKSKRPIPSGRISKNQAVIFAGILLTLSEFLSFMLDPSFFIVLSAMILLTVIYSIKIKNIFLLDVIFISSNFVLRALSGTFLIDTPVSLWLIIGIFLVALLLSFGKRFNEINFLNDKAIQHRRALNHYTTHILHYVLGIIALSLIIAYSIYAISGPPHINDWRLVISIPLVIFIVIQYVSLTLKGKYQGKEFNDFIFAEKSLLFSITIFILAIVILLYLLPASYFI